MQAAKALAERLIQAQEQAWEKVQVATEAFVQSAGALDSKSEAAEANQALERAHSSIRRCSARFN